MYVKLIASASILLYLRHLLDLLILFALELALILLLFSHLVILPVLVTSIY